MPTTTTTYSFNKPVVGADEDDWGGYLNGNWDSVDNLLDGTTPVTGIDINSGTIDNVVIGGATPAAGTFTTLTANTSITGTLATAAQPNVTSLGTLTSLTVSGDVSFGDNDKAIFGAGSDLQIYHSGVDSFIGDVGTGILKIFGDNNILLMTSTGEKFLQTASNGDVKLYYDNAEKLSTTATGVDITGTLTSDGLTVDGTSDFTGLVRLTGTRGTFVDSSENSLVPHIFATNDAVGDFAQEAGHLIIQPRVHPSVYRDVIFAGGINTAKKLMQIQGEGDISFYDNTGTTASFFWDASAERLGIGTSSPDKDLTVSGEVKITGSLPRLFFDNTSDGIGEVEAIGLTATDLRFGYAQDNIVFRSNSSERMRIDSSGNVGIGTTSPSEALAIHSSTNAQIRLQPSATGTSGFINTTAGSTKGMVQYNHNSDFMRIYTNATERMRIDSSGNVGIGTSSPARNLSVYASSGDAYLQIANATTGGIFSDGFQLGVQSGTGDALLNNREATNMRFFTGGTERMRIDSSGNLLVGKTTTTFGTAGVQASAANGLYSTRDGFAPLSLNRLTSDGSIAVFYKDTTQVGSIGTAGGDVTLDGGSGHTGIRVGNTGIWPQYNGALDNGLNVDLGYASGRFRNLYLSGGVYLGGTGAANKLDDYEEGTWTPVLFGTTTAGTFSAGAGTVHGTYTKVGNQVTAYCYISTASFTGAAGGLSLGGLPFTSTVSQPAIAVSSAIRYNLTLPSNSADVCFLIINNQSQGTFRVSYNNNVSASTLDVSATDSTPDIAFSITYTTSA